MEPSSSDIYQLHAVIKGRVQGVGFRAFTQRLARQLILKGTVQNLPDGQVEIYAQGPKKQLEKLLEQLKTETQPGQIEKMTSGYSLVEVFFKDFQILC